MEKQRAQSYEGGAGKEEAFQSLAIQATEMCTNDSIEMAVRTHNNLYWSSWWEPQNCLTLTWMTLLGLKNLKE